MDAIQKLDMAITYLSTRDLNKMSGVAWRLGDVSGHNAFIVSLSA
jgi:hypothetical protein